jgi:hypothetical protein
MPRRGQNLVRASGQQANLSVVQAPSSPNLNFTQLGESEWIRMLVYASPGNGKTSFIATGAAEYPTLIVRSSMDLIPARALASGAHEIVADTHEKMLQILEWCQHIDPMPYTWIWWDCISIAQDVLLDDVWEAAWRNKPGRNWVLDQSGRPTSKPNISPTGGKDKPEYGTNADRIQQWVRHMIGCRRFHFGITAHPMEGPHPTNDEGGDVLRPWIQVRQMPEKICGYMNMVGFLEVVDEGKKEIRRIHFTESSRYYAKDHFDAFLPDGYVDDPTIPQIMRAVEAARGGADMRNRRGGATATRRGRREQ